MSPKVTDFNLEEIQVYIDATLGVIFTMINIIQIIVICRMKRAKKIFEMFILSLSIADFLFSFSNALIAFVYLSGIGIYEVLEFTYATYLFFILTSLMHLLWIALDRLWAVHKPLKHLHMVTKKRANIVLFATWVLTLIAAISVFIVDVIIDANELADSTKGLNLTGPTTPIVYNGTSEMSLNITNTNSVNNANNGSKHGLKWIVQFTLSTIILLGNLIYCIAYSCLIFFLQKRRKRNLASHADRRATFTCLFLAGSFVSLTSPYPFTFFVTGDIPFWVTFMLLSNSGFNSIIYLWRNAKCT